MVEKQNRVIILAVKLIFDGKGDTSELGVSYLTKVECRVNL